MNKHLLSINGLSIAFSGHDKVVNRLSLNIKEKETLALVGESGSGKSLTALSCVRLLPSHANVTGEVIFQGKNLSNAYHTKLVEDQFHLRHPLKLKT